MRVERYNLECPGLGYESAAETKAAFKMIAAYPLAWPAYSPRTRRCLINRFPYGILYQPLAERIVVVALMHLKRDPKRWDERAGGSFVAQAP